MYKAAAMAAMAYVKSDETLYEPIEICCCACYIWHIIYMDILVVYFYWFDSVMNTTIDAAWNMDSWPQMMCTLVSIVKGLLHEVSVPQLL